MQRIILSFIFGGVVVFTLTNVYFCFVSESRDVKILDIPEAVLADTYFKVGQYYFNHDDSPAGPYDLVKAREYYEAAIAQDPKSNIQLWYQLGRVDFIEGKFDDAIQKFDTQIEYFGNELPNVYYMVGLTYGYKARQTGNPDDWKKGEEAFETFIEIMPLAPWSRVDLAWLYFSQGKYEEMKPVLSEGLMHRPGNAWLLNMYGLAVLNTGNKAEALQYFSEAQVAASRLTEEDWGKAYPGNNPEAWGRGLSEFREIIQRNINLAKTE